MKLNQKTELKLKGILCAIAFLEAAFLLISVFYLWPAIMAKVFMGMPVVVGVYSAYKLGSMEKV